MWTRVVYCFSTCESIERQMTYPRAYTCNVVHMCVEVHTVGAAVSMDDGELFALNAGIADSMLHVYLPASVCALLHSQAACVDHHGCLFCSDILNRSLCYAADDILPPGYVDILIWPLSGTSNQENLQFSSRPVHCRVG